MAVYVPLSQYLDDQLPVDLPQWSDDALEDVAIEPLEIPDIDDLDSEPASATVLFDAELALSLPGLDAVEIVLAPGGGGTVVTLEVEVDPVVCRLVDVPIALRLDESLLTPVEEVSADDPADPATYEPKPDAGPLEIELATITVEFDLEGNVDLDLDSGIDLPPVMIGDTGVVVSASDLTPYFGAASPDGEPDSWNGVTLSSATLVLPGELGASVGDLSLEDAKIGNGGFSGTVTTDWSTPLSADLFGIEFELSEAAITLVQNTFTECDIGGAVTLPFFEEMIDVDLGIAGDGAFTVAASSEDGLYAFSKPAFDAELETLEFRLEDATFTTTVGGRLEPDIGYDLPPIKVSTLEIDSDGSVSIPGGWLDLPDQYSIDLGGVGFEITQFGMGHTDDGKKWIGLNGGINLLEGVPAGASVDGLRIAWDESDPSNFDVSLDGVGVEFEVPGTARFKGAVSLANDEFTGEIDLELLAIDMTIDAQLVFGTTEVELENGEERVVDYMGVKLGANLPAGIPLWATGLSLYGVGALFAKEMAPAKGDEQEWFAVSADPDESYFHEDPMGIDNLNKWTPAPDAVGFGASVDVATAADNGQSVATDLTLVISLPGPIIMLQGRAELLEEGAAVGDDAPYQAIAILDNQAGSFTLGVDARYDNAPLLEIGATAEAFYDFNDPMAWYLHLGEKEPRENRIRAEALSIFTAESYLMLDPSRLAMGIWTGYEKSWTFGPLSVGFSAYVSSDVLVNFQPAHFYGIVEFHGEASLEAFGFGAGVTIHASVEADVFDPFHLVGEFSVSMGLPWPLPDPEATVTLEWGPEPTMPEPPKPLDEVGIGHEKLASTWAGQEVDEQTVAAINDVSVPADEPTVDAPVVPLDSRPEVTFSRPIHNDSNVADNSSPPSPEYELIGDPAEGEGPVEVRYALADCRLLAWHGGDDEWQTVEGLDGTWAVVPNEEGDGADAMTQTKLQVSSRTPYHYSRHAGGVWEDAIDRHFGQYPCPAEIQCYDFEGLSTEDFDHEKQLIGSDAIHRYQRQTHAQDPWARFYVADRDDLTPAVGVAPTQGPSGDARALVVHDPRAGKYHPGYEKEKIHGDDEPDYFHSLEIHLPELLRSVRLRIRADRYPNRGVVRATNTGDDDPAPETWDMDTGEERTFVFTADDGEFHTLELDFDGTVAILEVCEAAVDLAAVGSGIESGVEDAHTQLARWSDAGDVLEPYTDYMLEIVTTTHIRGRGEFDGHDETTVHADYVGFRTEGPPGLSTPDLPAETDKTETGLETLSRYVTQTTPPTVPADGERPPLPRPVYRADPVGVDFASDYVDLLYRLANRDLALYLYDANDKPIRDEMGRLVVAENPWGVTDDLLVDRATRRWFERIEASPCLDLDDVEVERTKRIKSTDEYVLKPDTVHEVRLTPLLYRETWNDDNGWETHDSGSTSGNWESVGHDNLTGDDASYLVNGRIYFGDGDFLEEVEPHRDVITITIGGEEKTYPIIAIDSSSGELTVDGDPNMFLLADYEIPERYELRQHEGETDGTVHYFDTNRDLDANDKDQPTEWTDVRMTATVGTDDADGVIGVVFRRNGDTTYTVELDAAADECRLLRKESGTTSESWIAAGGYTRGVDHELTVEAIGPDIHVIVDGESVLQITDPNGPTAGTVGLYCRQTTMRCPTVRIDDFRNDAPTAYQFSFTTSHFVDARHHVHSFDDEIWTGVLPVDALPATSERADPDDVPTEAEHRAFRQVEDAMGGDRSVDCLEITRLLDGDITTGLLVQSPEPIDWKDTSLSVLTGPRFDAAPTPPETLKLTGVDFESQTMSVLCRETESIAGKQIEYRRGIESDFAPTRYDAAFRDDFKSTVDLNPYTLVNPMDGQMTVDSTGLAVKSGSDRAIVVRTDDISASGIVTMRVDLAQDAKAGVIFRFRAPGTYYRFGVGSDGLALTRSVGGTETALWSGGAVPENGPVTLSVAFEDGIITGFVDDVRACRIADPAPSRTGMVGVSVEGEALAETLSRTEATAETVLLSKPFTDPDPSDWTFVKEPPYSKKSIDWQFDDGELAEHSNIYGFVGGRYAAPGTYGTTGDRSWTNYRTTVSMQSEREGAVGAIGVIVRYTDDGNYYRFSMDATREYRRLVRIREGQATLLWEDDIGYEVDRDYQVTVDCVGDRIVGYLDGDQLFDIEDDGIQAGSVGLYCRSNEGARFKSLSVVALRNTWIPYHEFEDDDPISAGTRLNVTDGNNGSPTEPMVISRVRNGLPITLPTENVHFRVRKPDGTFGHIRQFRPEDEYDEALDVTVVRSADGTGFLFCRNDAFPPGQCRLMFTSDTPKGPFNEPVTIDVPWDRP